MSDFPYDCNQQGISAKQILKRVVTCDTFGNIYFKTSGATCLKWYGVEYDVTASDPDVTRIAEDDDFLTHVYLCIQSQMRGCLLNDDGTVNYYLDADDWSLKTNGEASNLDGTDGQVMVEIPEHWERFETDGNIRRIKMCLYEKDGFTRVPVMYVSAYKATVYRPTNILSSVQNMSADYRGGNNNAGLDGTDQTQLGKPATLISRTNFRTYARNRGSTHWNLMAYDAWKTVWWLFVIEYATRQSQKAVNGTLTPEGYRQGGLGNGVTTVDSTAWNTFNSYYPLIPCGTSNSLANGSGEVDYTIPNFGHASGAVKVNRYRGVEDPFGDIYEWIDGVNFNHINGVGSFGYIIDNYENYADATAANSRTTVNASQVTGYIELMHMGAYGDIIPTSAGGVGTGSNTYFCDRYYSGYASGSWGWRALLAGGNAYAGAYAGFVFSLSSYAASYTYATIGSRLCFLGA